MKVKVNDTYIKFTLEMTREEFKLLLDGIGSTSIDSRVKAGMTDDQSRFMDNFYELLCDLKFS